MKIKINENESYEIITDEITLANLVDLVNRLHNAFPSEKITTYSNRKTTTILPREVEKKREYTHSKQFIDKQNNIKTGVKGLTRAGTPRQRKFTPRGILTYSTNRDEAIVLLRLHYLGTKEEKLAYAKKFNKDWNEILKSTSHIKDKFKITPQEVGIKFFPSRGGMHRKDKVDFILGKPPTVQSPEKKDEVTYY